MPLHRITVSSITMVAGALLSTMVRRASSLASSSTTETLSPNMAIAGARRLGGSDLIVSEACLGTMTYGVQNTQEDAFAQMDYATQECGVNFIDTAELYPVPLTAPEWCPGVTEEIVGNYLQQRVTPARRDELVIATKMVGYFPRSRVAAVRSDLPIRSSTDPSLWPDGRLDASSVRTATEASLRRLRTDRIDLMQIHWPDRYLPSFGESMFRHERKRSAVSIEETVSALRDLIDEGKIRYVGLSNESTLGVCEWVKATEKYGIRDKLVSIQNSYNLLDRRFDSELAEACDYHDIGLLPWSVLAGGLLSGKYRSSSTSSPSPDSRFLKYPEYMKRWSPSMASAETLTATDAYANIADRAGMTPAELAIAFVRSRKFVSDVGSIIVGATTMEQLRENLAPFDPNNNINTPSLSKDVLEAIDKVHMKCRNPGTYL